MKKGIIRVVCLILTLVLALSAFAGCSKTSDESDKKEETKPTENTNTQAQKTEEESDAALPIVKEPITIKYWVEIDGKPAQVLKNYSEMAAFREVEKITNIKFQFLHPPAGQGREQFNLMIASGDLPDVIEYNWRNVPGGPAKATDDKTIVKLNDLIDKYAPNYKKLMAEHPEWRKQAILDDGTHFMFPFIRGDEVLISWRGLQIRKDWLDKLGLQLPKTLDDWYTVLKAFKEKDPNGNGKNDEIPFGQFGLGFNGFLNFMYAWGLGPEDNGFYNNNGKVAYSYIQPAYKEFLANMNKWYKEGLIDPDYLVIDRKLFDTKMMNELIGATVGGPEMGFLGYYMKMMKDKNPNFDLQGVEYPIGPASKSYGWKDRNVPGHGAAITTSSKYQKEITRLMDCFYGEEGRLLLNFGPKGYAWDTVDGKIKFTDIVLNDQDGFDNALTRIGRATFNGPMVQHRAYVDQGRSFFAQQSQAVDRWKAADESLVLPPVSPTTQESQRLATIMNEVNTYATEMRDKFIMGNVSLDKFDDYAANIKKMNIEEAIEIMQAALDRYNKR